MSAHDPSSPRSTRSASPISISSESEPDESTIHLSSIKTLSEFYRTLVLKAAAPEKVRYKADPALLDRVSLLCVGEDLHESMSQFQLTDCPLLCYYLVRVISLNWRSMLSSMLPIAVCSVSLNIFWGEIDLIHNYLSNVGGGGGNYSTPLEI
jgi:hypothetical protein